MNLHARSVREALRVGDEVADAAFDLLLPDALRRISTTHWTPVSVARRAAALLAPEPGMRVLDVGAGPGKLCCIGALVSDGRWVGVEHSPELIAAACELSIALELGGRVQFVCGDLAEHAWRDFDSLYFYNPFEPGLGEAPNRELPARWSFFGDEIDRVTSALSALPTGTRVVTYHGFGGEMPDGFILESMERIGQGELVAWRKGRRA
jgi:SAM-dependent methyltransferase